MPENQNEVETTGEVGMVYTTQTGMDIANPELQYRGWEQIMPSTRVAVESRDIGMHQRWWVWRRVNTGTSERSRTMMNVTVRIPDFEKRGGLVPAVVQEQYTGQVLMHVYTRKEEFLETLQTGEAVFYSTSRKKRWKKGEEKSGNILVVHRIHIDCDGDALLYAVHQTRAKSGACHTGKQTCFFRSVIGSTVEDDGNTALEVLPVDRRLGS